MAFIAPADASIRNSHFEPLNQAMFHINMFHIKKFVFILLISLACVACDQSSKHLAVKYLQPLGPLSCCYDTLRLQYTENTGAMLSVGESLSKQARFWIFVVFVFAILSALAIYAYTTSFRYRLKIFGLSLITGGGFSNLIDRIINNGAVVDFMNLGIGHLRTGIFNIADFLIFIGIAIALIFHRHKTGNAG